MYYSTKVFTAVNDLSTHDSHDVGVRQSHPRSRWPHCKPSSDQYSAHSHTGTGPKHRAESLQRHTPTEQQF